MTKLFNLIKYLGMMFALMMILIALCVPLGPIGLMLFSLTAGIVFYVNIKYMKPFQVSAKRRKKS